MNILQILPELAAGGVETGVIDLSSALIEKGHKVIVVSNGGPLVERLRQIGVEHYKLPVHKKSVFTIFKCVGQLKKILKEQNVQIVHARSRVPAIIAAIAMRRLLVGDPQQYFPVFITTCHGYYSNHIFSRPMGWGKFVIVSSNIIARHMLEDFRVPLERIRFIPRGVDLSKFEFIPPSQKHNVEYTVGIIGRITPIKGHDFFIRAVSKAVKFMPKIKILVVGRPPQGKEGYLEQIKSLAKKLGVLDSIEFLGQRQDIPLILSGLDVLVLSSVGQEAFGRVVIEAAAAGVPVIATKVGGLTDIITDRKNGILVTPGNIEEFANAILEVSKDKKLAEKLAYNAIKEVHKKFTLSAMADKTLAVYREALLGIRILIIKFGAIGDVVLVTPSLRAIRKKFPNARISILVGLGARQILQNCPYVDELIIYNKPFIDKSIFNFLKLADTLRRAGFDIVIDFQNNSRSHILSFLSFAPKRFGYKNKKMGFLLNYTVQDTPIKLFPVRHQFRILGLLGIESKNEKVELWLSEDDDKFIDAFLSGQWLVENQPLIGINIGGSLRWSTKKWPQTVLVKLCDDLALRGMRVVLTGAKFEVDFAENIVAFSRSKPINAVGKTSLNQLAVLIKRCAVFISPDSAPIHIAAAVAAPIVAIFGPTDPERHCPPADKIFIIRKDLKCSPCYKNRCRTMECIKRISIEEIIEATERFL